MTGCVVLKVQELAHPHHDHLQLGVPGGGLQGAALPGGESLLGTGLDHEDVVFPNLMILDIIQLYFCVAIVRDLALNLIVFFTTI